jgi:CP family cyanate transporter-like MFS transporter
VIPLWAGRTTALIGIVLIALNLRTAVSAISPIVAEISKDIELTTVGVGLIGALPPVFFAIAGLIAPPIAHRLGLERSILFAVVAIVIGHLARAFSGSYVSLLLGSSLTLAAMGVANVLLPPVVKRYFPDRIGAITAMYATIMSISTALPAMSAAPIADAYGWRSSLGVWAITAATALIPWTILLVRERRIAPLDAAPEVVDAPHGFAGRLRHSRVAIAIAMCFAATSLNAYAMFAWLPQMLQQIAGVDHIAAGSLLGLYSFIALPGSIIAPLLVVRLKRPGRIVYAGVAFFLIGYLGLLIVPGTLTWLWVAFAGIGPIVFPACLVLINLRTRNQRNSAALSGFVQGIGYALAAVGPLAVGVLHEVSGGWTVPLIFLALVATSALPFGGIISNTGTVEHDLEQRAEHIATRR